VPPGEAPGRDEALRLPTKEMLMEAIRK